MNPGDAHGRCSDERANEMTASSAAAYGLTGLPGPPRDVACMARCGVGSALCTTAGSARHRVQGACVLFPVGTASHGTPQYAAGGKVHGVLPPRLVPAGATGTIGRAMHPPAKNQGAFW